MKPNSSRPNMDAWPSVPSPVRNLTMPTEKQIRPTPTRNPYRHPNPKWIAIDLKSASNRLPIRKIYFTLPERYNLNMDILSPENTFAERILF